MRNTFAANHTAAHAAPKPMTTVSHTCHAGGGASDARRDIIANVLIGGMKLTAMLNVEFGARPIIGDSMYGSIIRIMIGPIIDCASAIWLTAAPIAIISAPKTR